MPLVALFFCWALVALDTLEGSCPTKDWISPYFEISLLGIFSLFLLPETELE